jgi:hypothetical protein
MRQYSSTSVATTLASGVNDVATTITLATGTGASFMGGITLAPGNVDQFTAALDVDTQNEEIIFVTGRSGDVLTVTRGEAGTTNITHTAGASIKHVLTSNDLIYFNNAIQSTVAQPGTPTIDGGTP